MTNEQWLINANTLIEDLKSLTGMFTDEIGFVVGLEPVLWKIDAQPPVDAVEVVHGRWIPRICSYGTPKCSICDWSIPYSEDSRLDATNYCPNCGAKMDLEGVK